MNEVHESAIVLIIFTQIGIVSITSLREYFHNILNGLFSVFYWLNNRDYVLGTSTYIQCSGG